MNPADVARVLTKASAFDQRTIGEADVMAWHEILGRVELADGLDAVRRHYTASSDRIMPADVLRLARVARDDRRRLEGVKSEALALPSRYQDDIERDLRLERGLATCAEVLAPLLAELTRRRERSLSPTLPGSDITEEGPRP